jgi:NitT/TauT family transport system permease protein
MQMSRSRTDGFFAITVILALWKLASAGVGADMILPPPEKVIVALGTIISGKRFIAALGSTTLRGLTAFTVSMLFGLALGFAAGRSKRVEAFMAPGLTLIRATPVLAVILIALIWFPSGIVPVFSAVVMTFPLVAADVSAGVRSTDPHLLQMASSFGISQRDTLMHVVFPSALPSMVSAAKNAIGLSWKVVVAGEVLSQPANALGTGMQNSRIMLETAEVFAWAAVGILLCAASDAVFNSVARRMSWSEK